MIVLDDDDKKILNAAQLDFPLGLRPFRELGESLGIDEDEVIKRLQRLQDLGAIRKIGPVINRSGVGGTSTLVAVSVPESRIEKVAALINEYNEVSHNYLRPGRYNIWFTLSAPDSQRIEQIISELGENTGLEFVNLPTERLFKIGVKFDIR